MTRPLSIFLELAGVFILFFGLVESEVLLIGLGIVCFLLRAISARKGVKHDNT